MSGNEIEIVPYDPRETGERYKVGHRVGMCIPSGAELHVNCGDGLDLVREHGLQYHIYGPEVDGKRTLLRFSLSMEAVYALHSITNEIMEKIWEYRKDESEVIDE